MGLGEGPAGLLKKEAQDANYGRAFFYIQTRGEAVRIGPGGYGLIPIAVPHALRNEGDVEARFVRVSVPVPQPAHDLDTQLVPGLHQTPARDADVRDPRTRHYGQITEAHMDPGRQSQELLDVSASMRTALFVYSGITLKMMVDSDLGAVLSSMFMVQYEPHGAAGLHDHPLEETYLFLDGTVEATFDGTTYHLEPGMWRGPASAASTASATATTPCAGWRPRPLHSLRGTATASPGTGTTCATDWRRTADADTGGGRIFRQRPRGGAGTRGPGRPGRADQPRPRTRRGGGRVRRG